MRIFGSYFETCHDVLSLSPSLLLSLSLSLSLYIENLFYLFIFSADLALYAAISASVLAVIALTYSGYRLYRYCRRVRQSVSYPQTIGMRDLAQMDNPVYSPGHRSRRDRKKKKTSPSPSPPRTESADDTSLNSVDFFAFSSTPLLRRPIRPRDE